MNLPGPFSISDKLMDTVSLISELPESILKEQLVSLINQLIHSDFHALVQLLYRIDVSEKKLKETLKENRQEDSAPIIANLIIERQLQKAESKKKFNKAGEENSDEEKW